MRTLFIILAVAGISLSSCKKFLEEQTRSELTPQTTEDYSQLLYGTGYAFGQTTLLESISLMSDEVEIYANDQDYDVVAMGLLPSYSWQFNYLGGADGGTLGSPWKNLYKLAAGCNIAFDAVDGSTGTPQEKNQLKGEAAGLRALYYWYLVNLYGKPFNDSTTTPEKSPGVPLIISPDLRDEPRARNTVAEVYDQIRKDIEMSISTFAIDKKKANMYRFNYLAARLLASRIYLFTEEWDKVIEHASELINTQPAIQDLNNWPADWYWDPTTFKPIFASPTIESLFLYGTAAEGEASSGQVLSLSEELFNQYETTDLRTTIYLVRLPDFMQLFTPVKISGQKRLTATYGGKENAYGMRTTEAYLNRAEAYAQKYIKSGNVADAQQALDDLNYIRSRRYKPADFQPVTIMPAADLLHFCRDERRRELVDEGHRWFDLRRMGMPAIDHIFALRAQTKIYRLEKNDPQYTLQIPRSAMLVNTLLEQNPAAPIRQPL
ncbi:MAG TPA: RagB/SusD family nutrient uptake outer membrane protein [Pseudobacter sp.]|nr:RagB/SusD family nutrient uptake outer membrane protein [Pseudobacter sp.]